MLNKYERIKLVRDLGVNTEDNILIKKDDAFKYNSRIMNENDEFSLRVFNDANSNNVPHYPIISKSEVLSTIPLLQQQGYHCILATPINPKDCLFAGAALKTLDNMVIEIANGPGTVRRVTHEGKIDERYSIPPDRIENDKLRRCYDELKDIWLNNVIFEFSYYNVPVGWKKEKFILWEITDDGTGKSKLVNFV